MDNRREHIIYIVYFERKAITQKELRQKYSVINNQTNQNLRNVTRAKCMAMVPVLC